MNEQSTDEYLLTRYLLGQLSEVEQAAIEERFLGDREYYQHLLIAEDELRCAYAKGSLPPAEREQFEKRFMVFPDERNRVGLARTMLAELSGMTVEEPDGPMVVPREEKGWWGGLLAAISFRSPALRFATVAAAVVLVGALSWLAFDNSRLRRQVSQLEAQQTAREQDLTRQILEERSRLEELNREIDEERNSVALLEQELAQQRDRPSADQQGRPSVISLILAPGRIRAGGEVRRLTIQQDSAQVRLMLRLGEKSTHQSYRAVILSSEGAQVWSRGGLRASNQLVIVGIPARLLAEDDYEINLTGLSESGDSEHVGDYYFTVLKQ